MVRCRVCVGTGIAVGDGVRRRGRRCGWRGRSDSDGQVEGIDAGTTLRIVVSVCVGTALAVRLLMPDVRAFCRFGVSVVCAIINGQE